MANNDVTTKIIVDAKDNSKAAFNQVENSINKVKTANESMATSIFKGVASWDLLKKGIGMAVTFLKSSVEASAQAQREMAMVRQNVENAGIAYDTVKDKIEAYSKSMLQMGFDDEETATSVSRLMMVTKDYNKALELNKLAADLARNKGIGLAEATTTVTQVTAGNVRVLKSYGIVLKDDATAADALAAMHDKVKGSMETFASTTEGKMQIMSVTYGNFKEQIGDIFGPALNIALNNFNNFLNAANDNAGVASESIASKLQKALAVAVSPSAWKAGGLDLLNRVFVKPAEKVGNFFVGLSDKIYGNMDFYKNSKSETKSYAAEIDKTIAALDEQTNASVQASMSALNLQKQLDTTGNSYEGIGKAGSDSMKKQADAMKSVLDKLKDYKQSIKEIQKAQNDEAADFIKNQIEKKQSFDQQLADMVASHKTKWEEANREIQNIENVAGGIKNKSDLDRLTELRKTAETEFKIIQPYLNNEAMAKMAETSDVERLITAFRAGQAEDTVATATKQAELVEKATNLTINFDLTNSTITDKNFIEKVKQELNKSLNLIRSTN